MSIAGASSSLVRLLQKELVARRGSLGDLTVRTFRSADLVPGITNHISLFLYRVGVDQTRRHVDWPRLDAREPIRFALGLELRYLLTVWGGSAEGEQAVLGDCIEILDEHAVVSGDLLDPAFAWPPEAALKISLEPLSNEDIMRLWDSLDPP
jgi:Pvc16 N-terminal domain